MNKILVDTNVILDLLARRDSFYRESEQIFSMADREDVELMVSALSIVNTQYILNDLLKEKDARASIARLKVLLHIHPLSEKIIDLALNDYEFKDFEDGIQHYTALESQCDLILTRNLKDFKNSRIPILSPKEYLAKVADLDK